VLAAACVGLAKGGFGGMGMLAVLLMAVVWPARESTGVVLPMLITGDVVAVMIFHRHARMAIIVRLLPPALAGIVCGWWVMPRIDGAVFGVLIGWLALLLTLLLIVQRAMPGLVLRVEKKRYSWPLGWAAGVATMLANAAGSVTTIYLLACRLPIMEFVGTSTWFFLAVNLAKIPFSASLGLITPDTLLLNLLVAPVVVAGVFAARWLLGKINQATFEWLMILFTVVAALRLITA